MKTGLNALPLQYVLLDLWQKSRSHDCLNMLMFHLVNIWSGDFLLGVVEVALDVKKMIENFRPYIPLIQGLRNPGMRQRHWEQVIHEYKMIPLFFVFFSVFCGNKIENDYVKHVYVQSVSSSFTIKGFDH